MLTTNRGGNAVADIVTQLGDVQGFGGTDGAICRICEADRTVAPQTISTDEGGAITPARDPGVLPDRDFHQLAALNFSEGNLPNGP